MSGLDNSNNELSRLLVNCERDNLAPAYVVQPSTYSGTLPFFGEPKPERSKPVEYICTQNEEIFVVSDLHISSGRNSSNVYPGTENFFADEQFARFVDYAERTKKSQRAILIINGDVFDFLRVTEYPGKLMKFSLLKQFRRLIDDKPPKKYSPEELKKNEAVRAAQFTEWEEILGKIGIDVNESELDKIEKSEQKFGLRTNNYKSVWKLNLIKKGHPAFFAALAGWLEKGNKLFIVKGNHDLEWYLLSVRNYLRLLLSELICKDTGADIIDCLKEKILQNVHFFDDSLLIDRDFYVEHGHRYDKFTFVIDNPLLVKSKEIKSQQEQTISDELNIPFGSFFNRYLINQVELVYPYIDNVRPAANLLPMMIRERFPLAVKILLQSSVLVRRMIKTLNGVYIRFMFGRVFWFALVFLIPVIILIASNFTQIVLYFTAPVADNPSRLDTFINDRLSGAGMLLLSYILSRIVSWFQLSEPDSLIDYAKKIIEENPGYRIVTMGHTHNPGEYNLGSSKWFYNTGTWIPIVEASSGDIRQDKTYTFLHLTRDKDLKLQPSNNKQLLRWNDDSREPEPIVLVKKK